MPRTAFRRLRAGTSRPTWPLSLGSCLGRYAFRYILFKESEPLAFSEEVALVSPEISIVKQELDESHALPKDCLFDGKIPGTVKVWQGPFNGDLSVPTPQASSLTTLAATDVSYG